MRNDVLNLTNPMEESELEQILGGGDGVFRTISHQSLLMQKMEIVKRLLVLSMKSWVRVE